MKKYELIYDNGKDKPTLLIDTDDINEVLFEIRYGGSKKNKLKYLNIWLNGQVLD